MSLPWAEPFAAALALRHEPGLVLLESLPGFGGLGRRSYLAARPAEVATDGIAAVERIGEGWWAGWLSHDLGREIESLPVAAADDLALPPLALGRYEFDHARRLVRIHGDGDAAHLLRALRGAEPASPHHVPAEQWRSTLPRPAYEQAVQRAIDYIRAGDVFQVNLSQRLSTPWESDPFALYARLRETSPAPFAALVRLGGADVISASPERFLRRRGEHIETRPIKGTRPRGADAAEDRRNALALRSSAKDRAENVMIVDLARNDLGRVARYGTVSVQRLCALESHPGVHHLVSAVEARLRPGVSTADVVRATFPPGSVTGAPKIRALEIIEELEPVRRGVYGGAVGYFGFGGTMDTAIAIRTMLIKGDTVYLQAGAGIVADSDPEREHAECLNKARGMLQALKRAEQLGRIT